VVDETLAPQEVVLSLARQKALAVVPGLGAQEAKTVVLAADTIVVLDKQILGKPSSQNEAKEMLSRLSGRCHQVFTGVALYSGGKIFDGFETSSVYIRKLDNKEIERYVQTGEPDDKAGAYALQGIGSAFVEKIEGCYTNIIGLPMPLTVRLLREAGFSLLGLP
jgi:septum formation protein